MKYIHTSGKLIAIVSIILFTGSSIYAQEPLEKPDEPALISLSGKVVDTKDKPIAGFAFTIQPLRIVGGRFVPVGGFAFPPDFENLPNQNNLPGLRRKGLQAKTETDGTFKVSDILPGFVQINVLSNPMLQMLGMIDPPIPPQEQPFHPVMMDPSQTEMQIQSIRLNKVTFFYTEKRRPFNGFVFGLTPGVSYEDVKITLKKRLKFRARILFADGTPLANTEADLTMRYRGGEFGTGGGTHGTDCFTNAEGYFTQYRDDPGIYTVLIRYEGLSGAVGPFVLKEGEEPENIVIKLNGNRKVRKPRLGEIFGGKKAPRPQPQPEPQRKFQSVWVIKPDNGHAYKKIFCKDWHDAQRQAIEENSHLVSINDEDEQFWLEIIFGSDFWIGLNDVEKEGEWRWDSGEPVTYSNWTDHQMFPDRSPETERDFVAITFHDGGWQSAGPNSHLWSRTRYAVIEKDGLVSKIPKAAGSEYE